MRQDPDPLWTMNDMAAFLHVSKVTLYRMVKKGEVPHVRVGKKIFFLKAGVERWLEAKQQGGKVKGGKK